jgi:hypothetical protein
VSYVYAWLVTVSCHMQQATVVATAKLLINGTGICNIIHISHIY